MLIIFIGVCSGLDVEQVPQNESHFGLCQQGRYKVRDSEVWLSWSKGCMNKNKPIWIIQEK